MMSTYHYHCHHHHYEDDAHQVPDEEEAQGRKLEQPDGGVAEIEPGIYRNEKESICSYVNIVTLKSQRGELSSNTGWCHLERIFVTHLSAPNMPRKTERRSAVSNW